MKRLIIFLAENIKVKPWYIIMAKNKTSEPAYINEYKNIKEFKGKNLVGLEYEPLYEIPAVKSSGSPSSNSGEASKNLTMSFQLISSPPKTDGYCHTTAPMHGEDDYNIGVKYDLPIIPLLDSGGHFNKERRNLSKAFI